MTENQIKHMVSRFLEWKLPRDFSPDCGISYKRFASNGLTVDWPTGTNLFNEPQADAMVRYMAEGMPDAGVPASVWRRLEKLALEAPGRIVRWDEVICALRGPMCCSGDGRKEAAS